MDYEKFISEVVKQDSRNIIKKSNKEFLKLKVPNELYEFYNNVDVIDVEIELKDLCSIKLYPCNELSDLQIEYGLNNEGFVFATKEGDPIFIKDGNVFLGVHGIYENTNMIINNSFEEFLSEMLINMKG